MLKKIAITVATSLILFPSSGFCAIENELTAVDNQRTELLKQLTTGLASGKISIDDAQKIKTDIDNVIKLETQAKEDPVSSPEKIKQINSSLQQVNSEISSAIHPRKVWLGIDVQDKTLEQKITNALDNKKLTKEQAESFKQQFDKLRQRESNGDPTRGFEFTDAIALAVDLQTFNTKLDQAIAGK